MALTLHYHPLASFCWKVLIALYELDEPFEGQLVDLMDPEQAAALRRLWPIGKFPVIEEDGRVVAESSIIIEYLDQRRGGRGLLPKGEAGLEARYWDRVFDFYVMTPMSKAVTDRLRPPDGNDAIGVADAFAQIDTAYGLVEQHMAGRIWAAGEGFTIADCSAAPSLFYADKVRPLARRYPNVESYLERLKDRPSFARVLAEAEPYFRMFPG